MIPEAAVEAAARLIHSQHEAPPLDEWSATFQRQAKADARLALEAAAPHMLAEAWDAGMEATGDVPMPADYALNPYRSQE